MFDAAMALLIWHMKRLGHRYFCRHFGQMVRAVRFEFTTI
jgi:hypothetical protein